MLDKKTVAGFAILFLITASIVVVEVNERLYVSDYRALLKEPFDSSCRCFLVCLERKFWKDKGLGTSYSAS